jgi:hypothetical protein
VQIKRNGLTRIDARQPPALVGGADVGRKLGGCRIGRISRHLQTGITANSIVHGSTLFLQIVTPDECPMSEGPALCGGLLGQLLWTGLHVAPEQDPGKDHEHRNDANGNNQRVDWHGLISCDGGSMPARLHDGFELDQFDRGYAGFFTPPP